MILRSHRDQTLNEQMSVMLVFCSNDVLMEKEIQAS